MATVMSNGWFELSAFAAKSHGLEAHFRTFSSWVMSLSSNDTAVTAECSYTNIFLLCGMMYTRALVAQHSWPRNCVPCGHVPYFNNTDTRCSCHYLWL